MRLLTHNTLRNNSADAQRAARRRAKEAGLVARGGGGGTTYGGGYPLKITATEIRVDDSSSSSSSGGDADADNGDGDAAADREIRFVRGVLGALDWTALVEAAASMGISTLPPELTEDLASDDAFLRALYHVLMNVHLVRGVLTCPDTGREFPVTDGVANMMMGEEECERVRL